MRMVDLILKKKAGGTLKEEEIFEMIRGFTEGQIPDYQMSALLMAICLRGMNRQETAALTEAMRRSGDTMNLDRFGDRSVDKHSTGGVGDKTTLIVAPVVAALGGKIAKMSGRGLGHTGGTVDKLQSIPGFRVDLSPEEFLSQVERVGVAVIGQTGNLTPADKKLYALRDVTGTVDSLPLIASSIMSKKLAAGAHSIVLDVKVGSGAFMKTLPEARALAEEMVGLGRHCGRKMAAVLSNMNVPLGFCIGNALEVQEAAEVLQGGGCRDLRTLCVALSAQMLTLSLGWPPEESRRKAEDCLKDGRAFAAMQRWISAQGGDAAALEHWDRFPQAAVTAELKSPRDGFLTGMDTEKIGEASVLLGAGRAKKEDPIDFAAGIVLKKKPGDFVRKGEALARLDTGREALLPGAEALFLEACTFGETAPDPQPLLLGTVQ